MLDNLLNKKTLHFMIFIFIFLLGLNFVISNTTKEGYVDLSNKCPNVLIQVGDKFHLYNSALIKKDDINPITFNSLEEYIQYIKFQRKNGLRCPVLYVQQVYDNLGRPLYKLKKPSNGNDKLIDASHSNNFFNKNSYPGFDPNNQYIGLDTPLDKIYNDKNKISPNPMDTNWGGRKYTTSLIKKGVFKEDEVLVNNK